jgi:hypothetical protein
LLVVARYKYSEETNTQVLELKHHQDAVRAVLFNPDGQSAFAYRAPMQFACVAYAYGVMFVV